LRERVRRRREGARGPVLAAPALGVLCLLALGSAARAQPAAGAETREPALRVFLDCRSCDREFIKAQIPFVSLVSNRAEAEVEVGVRAIRTQAGEAFTLEFRGLREFAGDDDRLDFRPEKSAAPEEVQTGLARILELGLLRYAGRLPLSNRISIKLLDQVKPTAVVDPWNFWVFSVSGNSFLNGEKSYRNGVYYGSLSANRVTPDWKIRLAVSGTYQKDHFRYEDLVYDSSSDSRRFVGLVVRSLGEHWSVGGYFEALSSSYSNIRLGVTPAPAVEYDLYPYSESTRRQLRFLYRLNLSSVKYHEETVYGRLSERLLQQALSVTLELQRKWGTINASLQGSNYFHDFSKNRLEMWSQLSLRLLKGFSFNVSGGYSRIHDQLSLPAAGATLEEILLRRRQLGTSYNYYLSVGLSYTFGSTQSHVVNPRFGDGGGGISINIGY
jgi:hypothetical protein